MLELSHYTLVIPLGDALRITNGALDEGLEATFEQLIHLVVIVIVVPDAEHALYIVPDRPSEARRVNLAVRTHGIIRQIVCSLKLVVQEIANVTVQTIHQGVTVIVPRVILDAEGRYIVQVTALKRRKMLRQAKYRKKTSGTLEDRGKGCVCVCVFREAELEKNTTRFISGRATFFVILHIC